ncbi:MAG: metal-dependent hydrolase [Flavobacteriaceae bacterium]
MASVFGHAVVGFTLSKVISSNNSKLLLLFAIVSTILPDIDVLAFNFGIPYEAPFGHCGFTHSILFAVLWATFLMLIFRKLNKLIWWIVIFLSTISHGILDAMTSGGRGVGFFVPFYNERYFFPFRDIVVSTIGIERFFSERGMRVIFSELKYVFLPCFIILVLFYFIKKANNNK